MELLTPVNARLAPVTDADEEAAARRQRLSHQVAAVRRRSRLMRALRTLFPAAVVGLLVFNFGWIVVTSILNSFNVYGGSSDEIRMTNPRYFGQSGTGDHYTISGLEAIRRGKDATTVTLKAPVMEFKGDTDRATRISAASGVFDQTTRQFTLKGHVVMVAGGSDFTFRTEEAVVDLTNSTVHGDKHVEGTGSVGHIVGESFVISDNGKSVEFHGKGDAKVTASMQ
ncbi:MAG: LPS export ABC transporter periplasmic protein LptC [Asticcacaulis sp.]|nr:LPS export ABC transporter periplasmic protein LptC [Asticcacaulis sp.]